MDTEKDPTGRSAHETGAKLDDGKPLPDLVLGDFANALAEVVEVGTFGARKYTKHGWIDVPDGIERYQEAMMRHWLKMKQGESHDPDSGLLHASHFCWNALAFLERTIREFPVMMPEFADPPIGDINVMTPEEEALGANGQFMKRDG